MSSRECALRLYKTKQSWLDFPSFAHKKIIFERVPLEMFQHNSRFYAGDDKVLLHAKTLKLSGVKTGTHKRRWKFDLKKEVFFINRQQHWLFQVISTRVGHKCAPFFSRGHLRNDGVLMSTMKTLLRLPTVLLDHWKGILSGAIKFVSQFGRPRVTWVLSKSQVACERRLSPQILLLQAKYKGFSIVFSKILDGIESFTNLKLSVFLTPLSIQFSNTKILGFFFFEI